MTFTPPGARGRRLNRRGFLKLGALAGVAAAVRWPDAPLIANGLRIASALPLPGHAVTNFDAWPHQPPPGFDLLRLPAYQAAAYIRHNQVLRLDGPPGRAHDPEGAFTRPARYMVGALLSQPPAAAARRWQSLWSQPPGAAWPNHARLVLAAALLRRGYSPNDLHPGHLAQAEADLWHAGRPERLAAPDAEAATPLAGPPVIYALESLATVDPAALPLGGTPLIEYDWVIPASAAQPDAARAFLAEQPLPAAPAGRYPVPLIPLMPLPDRVQAHVAAIWARLRWLPAG